jgi:hypothetical protein
VLYDNVPLTQFAACCVTLFLSLDGIVCNIICDSKFTGSPHHLRFPVTFNSTGLKGQIQCSQATADTLTKAGKEHWVVPRDECVHAKGKGVLHTYWVTPKVGSGRHTPSDTSDDLAEFEVTGNLASSLLKRERQIEWVAELFREGICNIVANREAKGNKKVSFAGSNNAKHGHSIPLEEVVDAITMPEFDGKAADEAECFAVKIPDDVSRLVREYVLIIACAYRDNPFHNFEVRCCFKK